MKKTITSLFLAAMIIVSGLINTACFGSFALTKKVWKFNDGLGNKFVKSLVFWVLNIIPVYGVCAWVDIVILNLIEFWTGSNPLAMKPGQKETQLVSANGKTYEITATQNRFDIKQLAGPDAGKEMALVFTPENTSWNIEAEGQFIQVVQYYENDGIAMVRVFAPENQVLEMPASVNSVAEAKMVFEQYSSFALAK